MSVVTSLGGTSTAFALASARDMGWSYIAHLVRGGMELLAVGTANGSTPAVATIGGSIAPYSRLAPDGEGVSLVSPMAERDFDVSLFRAEDYPPHPLLR